MINESQTLTTFLFSYFNLPFSLTVRYFFALHPLSRLHSHWLQNHGHVFLLITWALGAFYAYLPLQYTSIIEIDVISGSSLDNSTTISSYFQCSYQENGLTATKRRLFLITNFLLTFAIPCLTLAFSYISIIKKLLTDQRRILASMNSPPVVYNTGNNNRLINRVISNGRNGSAKIKIRLPSPTVRRLHKRQLNYVQSRLKVRLFCV